jgi:hypothetical protein
MNKYFQSKNMKKFLIIALQCVFLLSLSQAQTTQQLRDSAIQFLAMPRETGELFAFTGAAPTFSSGTPFNDLEFTIFDTDYMEGETHGFDQFMPVDPADDFPGSDRVKLVRCVSNVDLDKNYNGAKGDRVILGTHEIAVPFFLRGADGVDNDFAVIQNFDFKRGFIQLKGIDTDYQLLYFTLADGVKTEGYYLFYTKNNAIDLVAFIFPCWDLGATISGNPPMSPLELCHGDSTLSLSNQDHFRFAQPISTTLAVPNGITQFGSNGKEVVGALTVDYQGNTYFGGLTDGNMDGQTDAPNEIFIRRINVDGSTAWTTELATKEGTLLIDATTDNTYLYAAGRTLGALQGFTNAGRWDGFLLKIRLDNGQIVATNQWGNAGIDGYGNIILDDTGNLYISGQGSPEGPASTDDKYLFAKHKSEDLSNIWRVIEAPMATGFLASAEAWGGLSYIAGSTPGDGKVVAGGWYITQGGANGFLAVYNNLNSSIGTRQYTTTVASAGIKADWVLDNVVDSDGNIYAAGFTTGNLQGTALGDGDAYIVKYSPTLTNPQFVQIGTNKADCFRKLDIDQQNGHLYALAYTYGNYATSNYQGTNEDNTQVSGDILVQKFDLNLNKLAAHQFGTPHEERALSFLKDSILYVGGMTEGALTGSNAGSFDGFLVALKTTDLTIVKPTFTVVQSPDFSGFKVYPNPTTGFLRVENQYSAAVSLGLFDITGRQIMEKNLGLGDNELDLGVLISGVYFLTFTDWNGTNVVKVVKD